MPPGDLLARGAKKASFAATDNPKGITDEQYAERTGAPLPQPKAEEPEELHSHVDNSALFAKKKPTHYFKGKPYGDNVLVRRIERESTSSIIIPDAARSKSDTGIVTAVGAGLNDASIRPGDLILFDKFASVGQEITLSDEEGNEVEHLMLREHDILLGLEKIEIGKGSVN